MIEERLLWTLLQFIGYGDNSQDVDDSTHETQRLAVLTFSIAADSIVFKA